MVVALEMFVLKSETVNTFIDKQVPRRNEKEEEPKQQFEQERNWNGKKRQREKRQENFKQDRGLP